jgi:hypothetical protein
MIGRISPSSKNAVMQISSAILASSLPWFGVIISITRTSIRNDLKKNVAQSVERAHLSDVICRLRWLPNLSWSSKKKLRVQINKQTASIKFRQKLHEY